jgi:Flp pilus assembly protein TadG
MVSKIRAVLKAGLANSKGSVTIEASIVLPVILLMLFSMVFFSMYVYHKLVLLDTAVYTAAQRAETWDHAGKNLEDGYRKTINHDGLYWRLFSDLSGYTGEEGSRVSTGGPGLVQDKSSAALAFAKDMLKYEVFKSNQSKITVQYKNSILRRVVSVSIYEHIMIPINWISNILSPNLAYNAEADVVEPAEFIRVMGLAEKYSPQILSSLNNIPSRFIEDKNEAGQSRKLIASKGVQYSRRVRVFHYQGCRYISRIPSENLIEFDSPDQANASGYYLCKECAKRIGN